MITGHYFEWNMQRFYHVRDIVFKNSAQYAVYTVHYDVQIFFNMTVFTMNLNACTLCVKVGVIS